MKKVKFKIFTALFFLSFFKIFSVENEISLFNDMISSINSSFYPGCIQNAQKLISDFPESVFIPEAYCAKGEAHFKLNEFSLASENLVKALELSEKNSSLYAKAQFFLAKTFKAQKKFSESQILFFDYCKNQGKQAEFFPVAVLESGRIFYETKDFSNAVKNFEYVISNGRCFSSFDYEDTLLKLSDSYNKTEKFSKNINLFEKTDTSSFQSRTHFLFMEFAADSYLSLGQYKKAYDLYCEILRSAEQSIASNALKKAYNVSSKYRVQVASDPGKILQEVQEKIGSDSLLTEFWTRMALDALSEKDFAKAEEYFLEAEKKADLQMKEFIFLSRAETEFLKSPSKIGAENAEKILCSAEETLSLSEKSRYFNEYTKYHIKYETFSEKYKNAVSRKLPVDIDDETKFYLALSFYNLGDFAESLKFLEGKESALLALNYAKTQKLKESAAVFKILDESENLSEKDRLNYAKVLLFSARYKEAQIQAAKCNLIEGKYILALAQFNTRNWNFCEENFLAFLKSPSIDKVSKSYAEFYLGYSKYRLGKFKESCEILSRFVSSYPEHELIWNALMTYSNAAVQILKFDDASKYAEKAVKCAKNSSDREKAVFLCQEIYSDSGNYEKAREILLAYSSVKNDFGAKCLLQIAKIYEKQKENAEAQKVYSSVIENFSGKVYAEEALYRQGELFYSEENFSLALSKFSAYNRKFPDGSFIESSIFYTADCLSKTGNPSRAILQYQSLLKSFPESKYVYISAKNLMELLRKNGKIAESEFYADFLLEKFGEQAENDGVLSFKSELAFLKNGYSEQMLDLQKKYEESGKTSSVQGRIFATSLASIFVSDSRFVSDGIKLAEKTLLLQEKNLSEESLYAAKNALLLADYKMNLGESEIAADYYLKGALYFKTKGLSEESSHCLYSAYSAFLQAGRIKDAEACAENLLKEFPKSKYAESIRNR